MWLTSLALSISALFSIAQMIVSIVGAVMDQSSSPGREEVRKASLIVITLAPIL